MFASSSTNDACEIVKTVLSATTTPELLVLSAAAAEDPLWHASLLFCVYSTNDKYLFSARSPENVTTAEAGYAGSLLLVENGDAMFRTGDPYAREETFDIFNLNAESLQVSVSVPSDSA
jgi:hypothetical protein